MFERYLESTRRTIHFSKLEADGFGSSEIHREHILLALLKDKMLVSAMEGISEKEIREEITAHLARGEPNPLPHDLPLGTDSRKALLLAAEEADKLADRGIRNGHILLGLLRLKDSYAAQLLRQRGLAVEKVRPQIAALAPDDAAREEQTRKLLQEEAGKWVGPTHAAKELLLEAELRQQILETTRRVGELLTRGQGRKALEVLGDFMATPGQDRNLKVRLLGHFAAATALHVVADIETARHYCRGTLGPQSGGPNGALYTRRMFCSARPSEQGYRVRCQMLSTGLDPRR